MEEVNKIKKVSFWIFIIPFVALNICWLMVVNYSFFSNTLLEIDPTSRFSSFSIPYIHGEFSISRTARVYPTFFIFKPAMILTAFLLFKYCLIILPPNAHILIEGILTKVDIITINNVPIIIFSFFG